MALSPPANTDMATMQALDRTEERLGARIDAVEATIGARIGQVDATIGARIGQSEARTREHVWKVVVGTGVVLYLATVGTLIGAGALLLNALDVI